MNYWYIIIAVNLYHTVSSGAKSKQEDQIIFITSSSNVKYITVPLHHEPVLVWMEARRGKYPNITNDSYSVAKVTVGEPITIMVFFKDPTNLYKLKVSYCWAYNNQMISISKEKLHLYGSNSKSKRMTEWKEGVYKGVNFLYSSFVSFKFPDTDQVFLSCEVELIQQEQDVRYLVGTQSSE